MNQLVEENDNESSLVSRFKERAKRNFGQKSGRESSVAKFKVRALMADGILVPNVNAEASHTAVDEALTTLGSLGKKSKRDVSLSVCLKDGVRVKSRRGKEICHYSIHQVGYCNVDKRYPEIVVFIAADKETCFRCHAFICEEAKKASAICLTLARTFQNGFDLWKKNNELKLDFGHAVKQSKSTDNFMTERQQELTQERRERKSTLTGKASAKNQRRNTDFTGRRPWSSRRLDLGLVSSSTDGLADLLDEEASRAWEALSTSTENGECPLLGQNTQDWQEGGEEETCHELDRVPFKSD